MARHLITDVVQRSDGSPLAGGSVVVREPGTASPLVQTMYAGSTGATTRANPLTTDDAGRFSAYIDTWQPVDLYITGAGIAPLLVSDFRPGPAGFATLTGAETLTNKTLSSPTVNTPSIVGGSTSGMTHNAATFDAATWNSPTLHAPQIGSGQLLAQAGTAGAPSIARVGDTDTGIVLSSTADRAGLVAGGIELTADRNNGNPAAAFLFARRTDSGTAISSANAMLAMHLGVGGAPVEGNNRDNIVARSWVKQTNTTHNVAAMRGELYLQGGSGGYGYGLIASAQADAGWTASGDSGVIGLYASGIANRSNLNCWGAVIQAVAFSGASPVTLSGLELDVGGYSGSSLAARYGLQVIANASQVAAVIGDDMMVRLTNKVGGTKWKQGIVFDGASANTWPLTSNGCLIESLGANSVARGIDLSATTFTSAAIAAKGFKVTGDPEPRVAIGDDHAPATLLSVRHGSSTAGPLVQVQGDNNGRLTAQLRVIGRSDPAKRLYLGLDTTGNWGLAQAYNDGSSTGYPLVLQPLGSGVVAIGDPTAVTPDPNVKLHLMQAAGNIALRIDGLTTASALGGTATALPAQPDGYLYISINGSTKRMPYYR